MKNEGKFRLKQIDFFGILSTHTTMIEEVDEEVQHRYDIIERDTPAYLDLWLRAQLHGYADDIDPNLVRDSVEREPIPLRSIRVPLINGLSSAWAPNGYGKTCRPASCNMDRNILRKQYRRFRISDVIGRKPTYLRPRQANQPK